ncbi:hypothetical protein B0G84_3264 [Paraburkholderia sp. BL8N3]|nr:hypothetical protein [Paraburkholderia sp. BL8N3]TCK37964.1 hypothetical protein B0G84_3264 [Paraburkholderia sp. BL8N3]
MTQVPSYQVPAHPSGLDMRTQLNAIILALIGDNAGPTAPTVTYPGMMWGDTTAAKLKRRTNANDAWVIIGPLDNFMGDVTATANACVKKVGDTMTGPLILYSTGVISSPLYLQAGSYIPHFRSNSTIPGFEWVNSANTVVVATLSDTGIMTTSGYTLRDSCQLLMNHTVGNMRLRGDAGIGSGNGGCGFINGAGNAWRMQITDEGHWFHSGYYISPPLNVAPAGLDTNGYQGSLGAGYLKLNQYDYGGYIDLMRGRSEDFQWRMHYNFTNGYLEFVKNFGGANVQFSADGNIYLPPAGNWLTSLLGAKSNRSTQIPWASGINELAALAPGGGDVIRDAGNPWAMEGLRCTGGGATWIWARTIWYATP